MIPLGPVVARSRVRAARSAAWSYLIDPDRRSEWWPELQLEARLGGAVSERWTEEAGDSAVSRDASGEVDVWVDGHAIGFRWREAGDQHDTAVLVTLRSQGSETGITVTETGFDTLPSPAERAAASQEGWEVLLRDLVTAVDAAVASGALAAESPTDSVDDDAETQGPEETDDDADEAENETVEVERLRSGSEGSDAAEGSDDVEASEESDPSDVEAGGAGSDEVEPLETEPSDADAVETDSGDTSARDDADTTDIDDGADDDGVDTDDGTDTDDEADDDPAADGAARDSKSSKKASEEEEEEHSRSTGDPDFDDLIRGVL